MLAQDVTIKNGRVKVKDTTIEEAKKRGYEEAKTYSSINEFEDNPYRTPELKKAWVEGYYKALEERYSKNWKKTKDSIMECPHCKSTFQKDHVRTRMRKWGKDSFYSTRHCPNCDKRIMLRDDNPDIESVNTRLSKLRTYCNYCKMNGQFDDYRDAMGEILELQKQIEDMRNGEMSTKVKDATNYNGEKVFQTYEAWKRACKQIDPNVKFEGDRDICQAGKVGEWDGDKGIIYNTKDSDQDFYTVKDSKPTAKDKLLKGLDSLKRRVKDAFGMNIEEKQKEFDVRNIEKETIENNAFRKVIFTGNTLQLVLMSLLPNEDIGMEVHDKVDQFFRVEEGEGLLEIKDQGTYPLKAGSSMLVTAGTQHNVINNGSEPLKLYTLYGPPNHPADRLQNTKAEAVKEEEKNKVFGGDKKTKDINYKSKLMELKGRLLEQKKGGASTIEIRNTLEEIKEVESIIRNNPSFDSKKTKDKISVYKYKGFTYEYDNENSNKVSFIKTPSGKVIKEYAPNAMPTITGVNGKIDAYIKQVVHDKKTKDASPADSIKNLLQKGYSLKEAILETEKSIGRQLNAFEAAEAVAVSKKMRS